jgi:hypothetical protein
MEARAGTLGRSVLAALCTLQAQCAYLWKLKGSSWIHCQCQGAYLRNLICQVLVHLKVMFWCLAEGLCVSHCRHVTWSEPKLVSWCHGASSARSATISLKLKTLLSPVSCRTYGSEPQNYGTAETPQRLVAVAVGHVSSVSVPLAACQAWTVIEGRSAPYSNKVGDPWRLSQ